MTSDAQLKANQKYLKKMDDVKIRVPKGKRDELRAYAKAKGFDGIQPYLIDLMRRDGLDLGKDDISNQAKK